ncbi:hypothetical protein ABIE64_000581 [Thalassospira sp. MBR-102]|jgi:hypothetical protein|uniref:Membrane protein n=1 Tax=Thalassospira xianhensis MCCC 1A02616 TaxID=1177929 RepID=A0A367UFN5_9PROT|nr:MULTISPECIES: DUF2474 family protein [Thalassospira]MBR9780322.1 DUF2474 family protein [Rhodospirillales bacterium]MAB35208.1 DUF2474 domain-containing protein [Thalassospira sp.]MAL29915.1 DUF2474 domain-containing protein [Thalassospira sp.]MBL4843258.1 DUF2474 family protein [Thalassospira sp.]MBR9815459.1 DUF2474 family protein [Rhodospirillales bacterium]|tara:strand:- start:214 stop:342 length:129 start_codon:yes stop_codon:yes gene_type:complete
MTAFSPKPKTRRVLWFIGLYAGGILVIGAVSLLLRSLITGIS